MHIYIKPFEKKNCRKHFVQFEPIGSIVLMILLKAVRISVLGDFYSVKMN